MAYYATIVKWPVCQDNLGKVVPQCQTTLGFTVAKDDGGSSGDNWDSETCAGSCAPSSSQITITSIPFFTGWMPFTSYNQQCQSTEQH